MNDTYHKNSSILPISVVMQITKLSARQIRYYEDKKLIYPKRSPGNHREFSFEDIDKLLEIKSLISKGFSINEIKDRFDKKYKQGNNNLSDKQIRKILRDEFINISRFNT